MKTLDTCALPVTQKPNVPVVHQRDLHSVVTHKRFPGCLTSDLELILDQTGKVFAVIRNAGNPYVLAVGERALNNIIREAGLNADITLSKSALNEINENLKAHAELPGVVTQVWKRIASIPGGIEVDLGDEAHTRIKITAGHVTTINCGSDTLFYRPQFSRPMAAPGEKGDFKLLKKYVNLGHVSFRLFIGWLSYTLAHPKVSSSKYVILAILGGQGSGKSVMSKIVKDLIDPSVIGVQVLPTNIKDLSIAAQHSHVLCYDNLRQLSHPIADALCIAATGGSMSSRQLYSDADQQVLQLHVALVLNGIHAFIDQPDLAQRCLPLYLEPLGTGSRKTESEMAQALEIDMPAIQRGLFDLIAGTLIHLPTVEATSPERMLDFCLWLAAMERADGIEAGIYQSVYSDALNRGQRDALLDNVFAAAMLDFGEGLDEDEWFGTPAKLLTILISTVPPSTQRSRDWPDNPIALSKRLQSLQAGLLTQGVRVDFRRGKERTITIEKIGGTK